MNFRVMLFLASIVSTVQAFVSHGVTAAVVTAGCFWLAFGLFQ